MVIDIKGSIEWEGNMGMDCLDGLMGQNMKGNGLIIRCMDMGSIPIMMGGFI